MQKKSLLISLLSIALIALMIVLTWKLHVNYFITSTGIVIASMVPVFFNFESKRPGARELVIIAIFVALSVASRVVFTAIPFAKPVIGMIMIAGFAFGPKVGFITGSMTAFVSNFFFAQGAWTPWQMLAYGIAGVIAGLFAKAKLIDGKNRITSAILGFICALIVVGPILDVGYVLAMMQSPKISTLLKVVLAGVPVNLSLAISTSVTLFLITGSMMRKMERVKIKYGVLI